MWLVACFLANLVAQFIQFHSVKAFLFSVGSQNLILWFACYVAVLRIHQSDAEREASWYDVALVSGIAALMLATSIAPHRSALGLLATAAGLYLLVFAERDRFLAAAGVVLLALSTNLVWGPLVFHLFTPTILWADAALVGTFLTKIRPDIVWIGTQFVAADQHTVQLVAGCSSFYNVSGALLAWVAVTMLKRTYWRRSDVAAVFLLCAVMVLVNAIRIGALAWSRESYFLWHESYGVVLLEVTQTALLGALAFWAAGPRDHNTR